MILFNYLIKNNFEYFSFTLTIFFYNFQETTYKSFVVLY